MIPKDKIYIILPLPPLLNIYCEKIKSMNSVPKAPVYFIKCVCICTICSSK